MPNVIKMKLIKISEYAKLKRSTEKLIKELTNDSNGETCNKKV